MIKLPKLWAPVLAVVTFITASFTAIDYTGNYLLVTLGANVKSKEFKEVKDFWLLDKNFENQYGGIKFMVSSQTDKVEAILIAGENFQLNGIKFFKCTSPLPYGITVADDTTTLRQKLGAGEKIPGRSAMRYYQPNIIIDVAYSDLNKGSITFIKFYNGLKPMAVKQPEVKAAPTPATKLEEKRTLLEKQTFYNPPAATTTTTVTHNSLFKEALMDVFKAYRESNFAAIKTNDRNSSNFWNYKFTYNTKLKIPGEKFNLLYCFPFITSPPDFVSVIKESDAFDASFHTTYKDYEKRLLETFPASEGWKASCIVNKESKTLSDLEFTNDHYGSVILDYSRSPKGRHILYLRFLLYSN
jgi:hypothetical protein